MFCIAQCTLLFSDLLPKALELFHRMVSQGGPPETSQKQIRKLFDRHTNERLKYGKDVSKYAEPFNCN